ncbi:MAG: hypothetical protein SGI77_24240 [Pirellulaceae bacterium]|nr:hypothetical protein [Pirellulaceae bacterium]
MAYFPYIVRTGSKDFENEIRNNATGARNATSKILPDGTTFMTTVGDRNGVKHTRSLVFDVNCFVPRRLSTETKKGEEIQSSYSHSVEYESAKGLFRPIMFSLDRSEVVSRIDPNTKQLKRIKMDVVATVTVEWLQFVEAELQFPDRKKCTATFPDVLPLLEISTPTKISSQQRTK